MALGIAETRTPGKAIYQLLAEARDNEKHARRANRCAFFRPVTIRMEGDRHYAAFSRDISELDIGLLHNFELKLGDVGIAISSDQRRRVRGDRPRGVPL
jgi:hypothetical protein